MALDAHKPVDQICNNQCHAKFQSVSNLIIIPTTINDFCKPLDIHGINGKLDVMNYLRKYLFVRKF
jgi:hypothetical protein